MYELLLSGENIELEKTFNKLTPDIANSTEIKDIALMEITYVMYPNLLKKEQEEEILSVLQNYSAELREAMDTHSLLAMFLEKYQKTINMSLYTDIVNFSVNMFMDIMLYSKEAVTGLSTLFETEISPLFEDVPDRDLAVNTFETILDELINIETSQIAEDAYALADDITSNIFTPETNKFLLKKLHDRVCTYRIGEDVISLVI